MNRAARPAKSSRFFALKWVLLSGLALGAGTGATARAGIVNLPDVTLTSLGHQAFYDPFFGSSVGDGVTIPSGLGTYTAANFTGQALGGDTVLQNILAPAGSQFSVQNNPQFSSEYLAINIYWAAGGDSAPTSVVPTVTFDNLVGTAPTQTYGLGSVGDAGNAINFSYQGQVTGDFSFTGVTFQFPVNNSPTPGVRTFTLSSNSSPSIWVFGSSPNNVDATLMSLAPVTPVPEPSSWALAGLGVVGLWGWKKRRKGVTVAA